MANLSSRPHRTKPAGSYVKPDLNGFIRLGLVIALFLVLAFIFFNFIAVPKTPATTEQVKSVIVAQGYEPKDITELYHESDPVLKTHLINVYHLIKTIYILSFLILIMTVVRLTFTVKHIKK